MSLLTLIIVLAVAGFLSWLVLQIPMPAPFRNIIIGVVCLFLVLWVLQQFGVNTGFGNLTLK